MKILVISDVHGDFSKMQSIIDENLDCEIKLYVGDFQTTLEREKELASKFDYVVRGNTDNDYSPLKVLFEIESVKIFMAHGHKYYDGINYVSKLMLAEEAKSKGAILAIHGHDHKASISTEDGVLVFNPGSPSFPRFGSVESYGIIEIKDGNIIDIRNIKC